jgi:hypothetical protein
MEQRVDYKKTIVRCKWDNMSHTRLIFYYFCDCFLGNVFKYPWNILEKSLKKYFKLKKNSYYFIKVYVRNLAKNVIFKKIQIHLQVFLLLKSKCYIV